jgi:hypothetical protein
MTTPDDAFAARARVRWLRPDALRWLRPDCRRCMRPGVEHPLVLALQEKANFDPNQPRVPRGHPRGGQWTDEDWGGDGGFAEGDGHALTDVSGARKRLPGIGHNEGPPLEPPDVPQRRPPTASERNAFLKAAAYWLARAYRVGTPVGAFLAAMNAASWLDADRAFIDAYQDPPRTLAELQKAASEPKWGYQKHHVAEKASARDDGFPESLIDGADNLVRVPALKHWQITGWYMTPQERFGGLSPRQYLRGKDWEERQKIGREALIEFGILKP